jgi:hypothetical protein
MLYELLPYLYLSIGAGGFVVNSAIVFVASISLITAGALVLVMRINYRRNIKQSFFR